jgi:hypothetical protein
MLNKCFQTFFLTYHYQNTKHVRVPLGTANTNAYFQDTSTGLSGCFTGWQVWSLKTCQPVKKQRCGNLKFLSFYSSNLARLDDKGKSVFMAKNETVSWYRLHKCFSLHFNTFKTILVVQLTFINFNYWKKILNFFAYLQATVRVPPFEEYCAKCYKHCKLRQLNSLTNKAKPNKQPTFRMYKPNKLLTYRFIDVREVSDMLCKERTANCYKCNLWVTYIPIYKIHFHLHVILFSPTI